MVIQKNKDALGGYSKTKRFRCYFSSELRAEHLREKIGHLREVRTILNDEDIFFDEETLEDALVALQSELDTISKIRDQFMGEMYFSQAAIYTGDDYEEITASGNYCVYTDSSIWLECHSSHDYNVHLVKLTKNFEVDFEWLNSKSLVNEESAEKESEAWQKTQEKESYIELERDMGLFDD